MYFIIISLKMATTIEEKALSVATNSLKEESTKPIPPDPPDPPDQLNQNNSNPSLTTNGPNLPTMNSDSTTSSVITLQPYQPILKNQGTRSTCVQNAKLRVLYCIGLSKLINYETLFETMKVYGIIERMKLKLSSDKSSFET